MTDAMAVRFLYVGQIRREKGVEDIVSAARLLLNQPRPFHISLAGPTTGWTHDMFAPDLVARVGADPALKGVVSFLGNVEKIDDVFRDHHVHLAPSIVEESYGLVVVEAKQNGLPSIIYPSGGMIELILHGKDGLVCERQSAELLANAMLFFLERPSEISRMGHEAKSSLDRLGLVRNQFTAKWATIASDAAAKGRRRP